MRSKEKDRAELIEKRMYAGVGSGKGLVLQLAPGNSQVGRDDVEALRVRLFRVQEAKIQC